MLKTYALQSDLINTVVLFYDRGLFLNLSLFVIYSAVMMFKLEIVLSSNSCACSIIAELSFFKQAIAKGKQKIAFVLA